MVQFLPGDDDLPEHAEAGYLYDWVRQKQKRNLEDLKKAVEMQKKVNKLTKKNKVVRRK
jgi:transposase-like protein